jgi:3-phenylpropionate/trans-cinnamate dioxygenase ferredoxin reductase subunit
MFLRPKASYAEANIRLILGVNVKSINAKARTIETDTDTLNYDEVILTTGSSPITLPATIGGTLGRVYGVRTLADIDAMAHEFTKDRRVLIIGGGYIGLEAAAVSAKMGLKVTVVEMADRILQRVASPETSDYFRTLHQDHGVTIIEGAGLQKLVGDGRVTTAELTNGQTLDIDMAIVGIGIRPNIALAQTARIVVDNGISTDAFGRTSLPHIWAAGDCASFPFDGKRIRLESVPNAIDQAETVAANILGANTEYVAKPWFWSDQFDVKLQIAGLNTGYDSIIVRGGARDGSVSHWYYAGARLLAVDAMNAPREFMIARRLIVAGKSPNAKAVADPETDLKSLM